MDQVYTVENIRIDDICRTERYYTATLLPYILFHESFTGLKKFLEILEHKGVQAISVGSQQPTQLWQGDENIENPEIITEMDIVRDVKFYSNWLPGLNDINIEASEMLRPDVMIIVNNLLLVVEGKFFHDAKIQDIKHQLQSQRKVIEDIVLRFPGYTFNRYCHIFLSARTDIKPSDIECNYCLSWDEIENLAEQIIGKDHYVTQRIRKAVSLYHIITPNDEKKNKRNYIGKESLAKIIEKCKTDGGRILVGYDGGVKKLENADPDYLAKRPLKWDWSDKPILPKTPKNWINGNKFLSVLKERFPKTPI